MLWNAVKNNKINTVKSLLETKTDSKESIRFSFDYACEKGFVEIVEMLLADDRVDPTSGCVLYEENDSIKFACHYGQTQVVRLLLTDGRANPAAENNFSIRMASRYGFADIVRLLLADERVDQTADNNFAIKMAGRFGHVKAYNLLNIREVFNHFRDKKDLEAALYLREYRDILKYAQKKELHLFLSHNYKNFVIFRSLPFDIILLIFEF